MSQRDCVMADRLVDVDCRWKVRRKWRIVDCICEKYCFEELQDVCSIRRDGMNPGWEIDGCWSVVDNDGSI
jgi:hypothetical protein